MVCQLVQPKSLGDDDWVRAMSGDIEQDSAEIDGMHVEWLEAGRGPLAICLHGFPDSAQSWRQLLPELAAARY